MVFTRFGYWLEDLFDIYSYSGGSQTLVERKLQEMHLLPIVNRTQVFSVEMPDKLRDQVLCAEGTLEEMGPREYAWAFGMLYKKEDDRKKKGGVH